MEVSGLVISGCIVKLLTEKASRHDRRVKQRIWRCGGVRTAFCDPAVVDRETDELIEKAIAFSLRIDSNTNKKLDGIMSLLFLNAHWL